MAEKAVSEVILENEKNGHICQRNKYGFCKFMGKCKFMHVDTLCMKTSCDIRNCHLRHPRECIYFKQYGRCKFTTYCRYQHTSMHLEFKMLAEQVRSYELKLSYLETKVSQLSEELDKRHSEIESDTEKELNLEKYTNTLHNIAKIEGRVTVVEQAHNILKQTVRDWKKVQTLPRTVLLECLS